jgi:hypothetical protein
MRADEAVRALEQELGITEGFLTSLMNTDVDDWSFVIKLHALTEAALTHLITIALGREELRDFFAEMQMGHARRGKIGIARRLSLIDDRLVKFIMALGRIRNRFAHRPHSVGDRIEQFVDSIPVSERDSFWRTLAYFGDGDTVINVAGNTVDILTFTRNNPKFAVWLSATVAVGTIYIQKESEAQRRQHQQLMVDFYEAMVRNRPSEGPFAPRSD